MDFQDYINWILHHTWVIVVSYLLSMIVLLIIHGSFGFTMNDEGTYLSNCLMHMGSGAVLGFGTGLLQKILLKKYFKITFSWVWALVIGFLIAELIAGIVFWKLEMYRGMWNIFNTLNHTPEAIVFASAGLIAGLLQMRILKPHYSNTIYWLVASTLGWAVLILATYFSFMAFILGAAAYGVITGFVFYKRLKPVHKNEDF